MSESGVNGADSTGKGDDRFAVVVEALLDVGQMALRAQRSDPTPVDGVIQKELERLILEIELYLNVATPESPKSEIPPSIQSDHGTLSAPVVVRTFADLSTECKSYLVKAAPGMRFRVPEKMPRPSNNELRHRYWELQRAHVPRIRAYKIVAKGAGRSWTRIRDIVSKRDERRRRRLKKSAS